MTRSVVAIALLLSSLVACARTLRTGSTTIDMRELTDKMELRQLVDTFAILADKKEARKQTELFTATGTVETYIDGTLATRLSGRAEIGTAFENFLKNFDIVYHFNGQHTVSIQGDHATGTLYCLTYLFGIENGKRVKTAIGIRYTDDYVRENGKWLIRRRAAFFDWRERDDTP